jgi:predicted metal-dependent phosphoesterase TrpH
VREAVRLGLTAIAITDHDSVAGVQPALDASAGLPLEVVPGVELSAGLGGRDLHILGYFVDHTDPALCARLAVLRDQRMERARAMVADLAAAGHNVLFDDVLAQARGGSVGRSHVARALVEAGTVDSVEAAFRRFIGRDGPFYVEKPLLLAADAIALIRDAGGAAALAHPGVSDADEVVTTLVTEGLVGIEAYHGEHDEQARERYCMIADYLGLIVTGGSDYHGPRAKGSSLGTPHSPMAALDALRARVAVS